MRVKEYCRAHPVQLFLSTMVLLVLAAVALWMLIDVFRPMPPRSVTMVTGPAGGAYHEYGERYREILAREGIELRLLPTRGAMENLHRLNDPLSTASVGFLQSGSTDRVSSPALESLGTIFYEPLWVFCRAGFRPEEAGDFAGRRLAVGPEGSGTRVLSQQLLARVGVAAGRVELLPYPFETAAEQLLDGKLDAAFFLTSWDSPVVRRLLAAEHVDLVSFPHADAHVALDPSLGKLVVPAAVGDIVKHRPARDTVVLATKASLVVRSDLHPAIQYLLLDAADQLHSGPGIFRRAGEFPAAESIDLPLSDEARRFYRSGQPFLQRYLPFWLAVLLGRLLVMLIPVFGLLLPLLRVAPVLYGWKMQRRVHKLYSELRTVELAGESCGAGTGLDALAVRLDQLEQKADHLWVPVSAMGTLYLFKEHLALVRRRLGCPAANPGEKGAIR